MVIIWLSNIFSCCFISFEDISLDDFFIDFIYIERIIICRFSLKDLLFFGFGVKITVYYW